MKSKKTMSKTMLLLGAAVLLLLAGCGFPGAGQSEVEGGAARAPAVKIFTAGYYNTGSQGIACYWIGTSRKNLSGNMANSILVRGSTIFVAGSFREDSRSNACFWRNGVLYALPSDGFDSLATSIDYNGGIYTAGTWRNLSYACYWTYKKRTNLSGTKAESIYVYDEVPYLAGSYTKNGTIYACYWRGTSRTTLPSNGYSAYATSIYVYKGIVYTAGWYYNSKTSQNVACYWRGTQRTDLSGSIASSIYIYNGIAYTAGWYYSDKTSQDTACYWRGTSRTNLSVPSGKSSEAKSISVVRGTVYTAGGFGTTSQYTPCYWVGTRRTELSGGTYGMANSIYVTGQ